MLSAGCVDVLLLESVANYDNGDEVVIKGWGRSGEEVPLSVEG